MFLLRNSFSFSLFTAIGKIDPSILQSFYEHSHAHFSTLTDDILLTQVRSRRLKKKIADLLYLSCRWNLN
jgi:hypothetical protein